MPLGLVCRYEGRLKYMDTIGCRLNGKSEARGRNGWFAPQRVAVMAFGKTTISDRQFIVEVWSKSTIADHPPIMLCLTETDAESLVALLQKGLQAFKAETVESATKGE